MFASFPGGLMHDARKSDCVIDHEDDVDWDNIISNAESDYRSGDCVFDSTAYNTLEEALEAMNLVIDRFFEEEMHNVRSHILLDAGS
jgi:hypothetical protein